MGKYIDIKGKIYWYSWASILISQKLENKNPCGSLSHTDFSFLIFFVSYFTSSKIATTEYQDFTAYLVQIRGAISILNVINQQLSKSIRVMLFRFYFVLFSVFLSFVGAKVQINCQTYTFIWSKCIPSGSESIFFNIICKQLIQ